MFAIVVALSIGSPFASARVAYAAADGEPDRAVEISFSDLPRWDWAYADIMALANVGLIDGYDDGTFKHEQPITRGEFAILLNATLLKATEANELTEASEAPDASAAAAATADGATTAGATAAGATAGGVPLFADPSVPYVFSDLSPDDEIYPYAASVRNYLRVRRARGTSATYEAGAPLLRSEAAEALVRMLNVEDIDVDESILGAYADAGEITSPAVRRNAALAVHYGIFVGGEDGVLSPGGSVSRAEACVLLRRMLQAAPWGSLIEFPSTRMYVPDADSGFYNTFFNDAVFVGDSVSQGLSIYVLSQRSRGDSPLGTARFVTAVSYSIRAAASDNYQSNRINLTWQGQRMSIEDCLSTMGAKELYLMLGVNDGVGSNPTYYRDLYDKALKKVVARNPEIKIRVQSCTPVTLTRETPSLRNSELDRFNAMLKEICESEGYDYVDIASPMKRQDNSFRPELSSDRYVHMNNDGSRVWIGALYAFARQKYIDGEWDGGGDPQQYPGIWIDTDI